MEKKYTDEKNVQILIALLKAHKIKKVIASPGTTNMAFIGSIQTDPFFEIYSCIDERSAAYMACGLSHESGEAVVLSCTGATASRNYLPGLTEAFYRKLPVVAVTSTQVVSKIAHHIAQVIDRSTPPKDAVRMSVTLPIVKDADDFWDCEIKTNNVLLELNRHGGGPVHINLPTLYSKSYDIKELPTVRIIDRIMSSDTFPELPSGRIGIFIGSHKQMSQELTSAIDFFCESHNAVVFCDHTSGYKGKYRVLYDIVSCQQLVSITNSFADLLIHIGEISGSYSQNIKGKQVWRVNEDGEIRDTYKKLRYIFEMTEITFFKHYEKETIENVSEYFDFCKKNLTTVYAKIPELPFSNIWIASKLATLIPSGSSVYLAIYNTLRSWNFFELSDSISVFSNVGGFGIDGGVSALIGASMANIDKLYFCITGDLAFFYDMNVLGNRHIKNNIRILLINNGVGTEFKNYNHPAATFGTEADMYMAAAGHYGSKSKELVKHYAQDIGFEYILAENKADFEKKYHRFISPELTENPILFEVFTTDFDESNALKTVMHLEKNIEGQTKQIVKNIVGEKGIKFLKKMINK